MYWTELSGADVVDLAYQLDNIVQKEKATERLFHVDINGMRVLSSLDVAKEVGVRRPMICKIPVTISAKKGLTVDFIPIKGETMITAIRILKMYSQNKGAAKANRRPLLYLFPDHVYKH